MMLLTIDNIIRAGACVDGAYDRLRSVSKKANIAAAMSPEAIIKLLSDDDAKYVKAAMASYGYCSGDSYGSGDG